MPKFLIKGTYNAEGLKGLRKDKASGREKVLVAACGAYGGKLDILYYALGDDDVFGIVDLSSHVHAASFAVAIAGSGMFTSVKTVALLTVAEMDLALGEDTKYRPPGG